MQKTSNYNLNKPEQTDVVNIDDLNENFDILDAELKKVSDKANLIQKAEGTGTAITLSNIQFIDRFTVTFIIAQNNNGAATTINGKPLYNPGTTTAPKLIAGRAATVWYDASKNAFFIKASASGTASPSDVLAGIPFSNEEGEQVGTMPDRRGSNQTAEDKYAVSGSLYLKPLKGYYEPAGSSSNPSGIKGWIKVDDSNFKSDNIRAGVTLLGLSGKSSVVDTADANAAAQQILYGYSGYVKGAKVQGSMNDMRWDNYTATDKYANGNGTLSLKPPAGYYEPTGASSSPSGIKGWLSVYDANFKAANIKKGVSIFGITGSLEEGKKFVSGTTGSGSVDTRTFYLLDGSSYPYKGLMVSGLTFTPSLIIIFAKITEYSAINYKTIVYAKDKTYTRNNPIVTIHEVGGDGYYGHSAMTFKGDNLVTSNGFTIPICSLSGLVDYYRWEAYE